MGKHALARQDGALAARLPFGRAGAAGSSPMDSFRWSGVRMKLCVGRRSRHSGVPRLHRVPDEDKAGEAMSSCRGTNNSERGTAIFSNKSSRRDAGIIGREGSSDSEPQSAGAATPKGSVRGSMAVHSLRLGFGLKSARDEDNTSSRRGDGTPRVDPAAFRGALASGWLDHAPVPAADLRGNTAGMRKPRFHRRWTAVWPDRIAWYVDGREEASFALSHSTAVAEVVLPGTVATLKCVSDGRGLFLSFSDGREAEAWGRQIRDACAVLVAAHARAQEQQKKAEERRHWSLTPLFSMSSLLEILESRKPEQPTVSASI
jgi:hypothetical protein